jgi:hypothetical protein
MWQWRYSSIMFDLSVRWMYVVSFTPRWLYSRGKSPGAHWIRGWVDTRAGLDAVGKRNILYCLESNSGRPAHGLS